MTTKQAIIKAAATLGKAANQCIRSGYLGMAEECEEAIEALQNSTPNEPIIQLDQRL